MRNKRLLIVLVYLLFLLAIPRLVSSRVSCLMPSGATAASYQDCTIELASDTYLSIAITGWAVSIFVFALTEKNTKLLIVFAVAAAIAMVGSYYAYLPAVAEKVFTSEIYLDTVPR